VDLRDQPPTFWLAAGGIASMLVGAVAPWQVVMGMSVGGGLSRATCSAVVALAVIAALFLWQHVREGGVDFAVPGIALGVLGALICALALYDILSVPAAEAAGRSVKVVTPGWGLYLALGGSVMLTAAAYLIQREATYY
jgi:hypothetical protein